MVSLLAPALVDGPGAAVVLERAAEAHVDSLLREGEGAGQALFLLEGNSERAREGTEND